MGLSHLIFTICLLVVSAKAFAVTSPWAERSQWLKLTVGASPCVKVSDPVLVSPGDPGVWKISLTACSPATAQALAFVLKSDHGFTTKVSINGPDGKAAQPLAMPSDNRPSFVINQFQAAFSDNPLISQVVALEKTDINVAQVGVQFKSGLISFVDPDSGEAISVTAPEAFSVVSGNNFGGMLPAGVGVVYMYDPATVPSIF